ncbi:hypothetical protein GCM10018962_79290 [Dactylosporangium matsuzakiense]|uniref:Uncharacterized protein n=1 Tax=Dactylosporangium matsuzakiense TaxID=53360 RepID=A0A9W6KHL8_9ACTN|nr:hypothetical protein GCM10017581_034150 [Dactylosporangium matsuzakiense]
MRIVNETMGRSSPVGDTVPRMAAEFILVFFAAFHFRRAHASARDFG